MWCRCWLVMLVMQPVRAIQRCLQRTEKMFQKHLTFCNPTANQLHAPINLSPRRREESRKATRTSCGIPKPKPMRVDAVMSTAFRAWSRLDSQSCRQFDLFLRSYASTGDAAEDPVDSGTCPLPLVRSTRCSVFPRFADEWQSW